jgi:hypothetical protein
LVLNLTFGRCGSITTGRSAIGILRPGLQLDDFPTLPAP